MSETEKANGPFRVCNIKEILGYQRTAIYDDGFILALIILMFYLFTV